MRNRNSKGRQRTPTSADHDGVFGGVHRQLCGSVSYECRTLNSVLLALARANIANFGRCNYRMSFLEAQAICGLPKLSLVRHEHNA